MQHFFGIRSLRSMVRSFRNIVRTFHESKAPLVCITRSLSHKPKKARFTSSFTLKLWNNLTNEWNELTMKRSKTYIVEKKKRERKCKVKSCKNRVGTCICFDSQPLNVSSIVCTGSSSRGNQRITCITCKHRGLRFASL